MANVTQGTNGTNETSATAETDAINKPDKREQFSGKAFCS